MENSNSNMGNKSIFSGVKQSPTRKKQVYTQEDIVLMQDHIDNWNPGGHIKEYIKAKKWGKICDILKHDLFGF